jgi:myo-inositol 2-dehydrogenase/D-chiro-inositol 1-dehydrogenase
MTIRLGIIGAGIMGADHARIFAERLPGVSLRVICDADEARARVLADALGVKDVMKVGAEVISRHDIDAVVIASPDFTHSPLSLACIKAGKPALCEKPLSQSSKECLDVMAAEQAAERKFVQIGFMRRFDQSYAEMRAAVKSGSLGRALMMHNFHRNVETPAADFTGAMAITNSAPHEFDVVRYVLGTEYGAIAAFQPRRSDSLVAPVMMLIETMDGQLVNIEINNNAAYGYDVRGELVCEGGSISMNSPTYSNLDVSLKRVNTYASDWRDRYAEAYWQQNKAFLHFVQTGEFSPIASKCWDGYAASVVAEAGAQALKSGQKTNIEMIKKPEFYSL